MGGKHCALHAMPVRIDGTRGTAPIVSPGRRGTSMLWIAVVAARVPIARWCSLELPGPIIPRPWLDRHEPVFLDSNHPRATARRSAADSSDGGGFFVVRRGACRRAAAGGSIDGARRSRPATRATSPPRFVGCHSMQGRGVARWPGIGAGSIRGSARSRRARGAATPPGRGLGHLLPL